MKPIRGYLEIKSSPALRLAKIPTLPKPEFRSEKEYSAQLAEKHARLAEFQTLLYANHERALLIIFQGMDTAGKDGAIKHVMSGVNPQGCSVMSFKTPAPNELEHDYLWRANQALPVRGQIGIFNRSYYEEVLVTRVHPELLERQRLPNDIRVDENFWRHRYQDIVNYEKYLHRQGYEIIKIFLHISKSEQKRRLLDRFQNPKKQWKISEGDLRERAFWKNYQEAYEECLRHTASKHSPWYIVPGDDKESARLNISKILISRLGDLGLRYPRLKRDQRAKLRKLRALLARE